MLTNSRLLLATLLAGVCLVRTGHAQPEASPYPTTTERVHVHIVGAEPGVQFRIRTLADRGGGVRCDSECSLALLPDRYQIAVYEDGRIQSSRKVTITHAQRLTLTPPDISSRNTGIGLAIGGGALFTLTSVVVGAALVASLDCEAGECDAPPGWVVPVMAGGFLGGVTLGVVGGVMVLTNLRPSIDSEPLAASATRTRRLAEATATPAGLTWSMSF